VRKCISLIASFLLVTSLAVSSAHSASKTVPYKNQKVGQFCKTSEVNKTVSMPDGSRLICLEEGARARWQEWTSMVKYVNQKRGQFCKEADLGKSVKLPDGLMLKCLKSNSRARWTAY
jgi:hypothetical protein